uniref:Uncharacterized protein n=1 Tax=Dictyoglomus thermophilum TaxID=14 RepID=A0A7C3MJH3_DICTH
MKKVFLIITLLWLILSISVVSAQNFNVPQIPQNIPKISVKLTTPVVLDAKSSKIIIIKKPPITFKPFDYTFFKIQKSQIITLSNGKKITSEDFLKEINEIEKTLNSYGYSLRDPEEEILIQRIVIPKQNFEIQRKIFKEIVPYTPETKEEPPKEFKNLNWERIWELPLGNEDFNVKVGTGLKLIGEEKKVNSNAFAYATVGLLGKSAELIKVETDIGAGENNTSQKGYTRVYILGEKKIEESFKTNVKYRDKSEYNVDWSFPITCPVGPFNVSGSFGLRGKIGVELGAVLDPLYCSGFINPYVDTSAYAEIGLNYKVASAGVGGELTLLKDKLNINGNLNLVLQNPVYNSYFQISAKGENELNALSGNLYFFVQIDYLVGKKKFKAEIYEWDGFKYSTKLFEYNSKEPAYKDKELWLSIKEIRGLTPYSARNEDLKIKSNSFRVIIDVGAQTYSKEFIDLDKNGILSSRDSIWNIKIPLSSQNPQIPIKITVQQIYSLGELKNLTATLDLSKDQRKEIDLFVDINSNTFTGTINGKIDEEKIAIGDTNYWGERYHQLRFILSSSLKFQPAPAK